MSDLAGDDLPMPISRPIMTTDVPGDGRHVIIRATDDEIAALIAFAGIEAIDAFAAEVDVKPWGKTGFRVTGKVSAAVVQACVVTLEPVNGRVDEPIEVKLAPIGDAERYQPKPLPDGAIVVDMDADDSPDFFDGPTIDVGAIVVEFFVLGLDPYPRKQGVEFEPLPDPGKAEISPFAKLAVLKRPSDE
jgi:uncharacterized metal-binding protein YceD (DUF177 family)